jgi:hypothetical protein
MMQHNPSHAVLNLMHTAHLQQRLTEITSTAGSTTNHHISTPTQRLSILPVANAAQQLLFRTAAARTAAAARAAA